MHSHFCLGFFLWMCTRLLPFSWYQEFIINISRRVSYSHTVYPCRRASYDVTLPSLPVFLCIIVTRPAKTGHVIWLLFQAFMTRNIFFGDLWPWNFPPLLSIKWALLYELHTINILLQHWEIINYVKGSILYLRTLFLQARSQLMMSLVKHTIDLTCA